MVTIARGGAAGPKDWELFADAAETDDSLGAVLRAHLLIELLLNEYLSGRISGGISEFVKKPRDFSRKLELAVALGFPLEIARPIWQLNHIRNKLAHGKLLRITADDLEQLVRTVNELVELDSSFVPVERRFLELPTRQPGVRHVFGSGVLRIDFILAFGALYVSALAWVQSGGAKTSV